MAVRPLTYSELSVAIEIVVDLPLPPTQSKPLKIRYCHMAIS